MSGSRAALAVTFPGPFERPARPGRRAAPIPLRGAAPAGGRFAMANEDSEADAAGELTRWLGQLRNGDREALDRVVARVYTELRTLARQRLRGEWNTGPMRTTELV